MRHELAHLVVGETPVSIAVDLWEARFEARIGDELGVLAFTLDAGVLSLNHTEVPLALRGKGIAEALTRAALDYARDNGLTVTPRCPFVARFISAHSEYQHLVAAHDGR